MSEDLILLDIILNKVIILNKEASRLRDPKLKFFSFGSFDSYFKTVFNVNYINSNEELISIINSIYHKNATTFLNFDSEIDRLHRLWYNIIVSMTKIPEEVYYKIKDRLLTFSSDFLTNALDHILIDIERWYSPPNGIGYLQCINNLNENAIKLLTL
jgi:hypothetical protein